MPCSHSPMKQSMLVRGRPLFIAQSKLLMEHLLAERDADGRYLYMKWIRTIVEVETKKAGHRVESTQNEANDAMKARDSFTKVMV